MWSLLSDPAHSSGFDPHDEADAPLRQVVKQLAERPYAGEVYAYKALTSFYLTSAPTYQQQDSHDVVGIAYDPMKRVFGVSYCEWISQSRNPPHCTAASHTCEEAEVIEVVDRYVLRLLFIRQERFGE